MYTRLVKEGLLRLERIFQEAIVVAKNKGLSTPVEEFPRSVVEVPIFYVSTHDNDSEIEQAVQSFQQAEVFPWPDTESILIGENTRWKDDPIWGQCSSLFICYKPNRLIKTLGHLGDPVFLLHVVEQDKEIHIEENLMILRRENLAPEGDFQDRLRAHHQDKRTRVLSLAKQYEIPEANVRNSLEEIDYGEEASKRLSDTSPDWHWVAYDVMSLIRQQGNAVNNDIHDYVSVDASDLTILSCTREMRDEITGSSLIRAFCNLVVPCHYYVKTSFEKGFGPKKFARAISQKSMYSVISFDRLRAICLETQGSKCEPHPRRGHFRYFWKKAGLNRMVLPDSPAQRFAIIKRFQVERTYIQPTWVGPASFTTDGIRYEIEPEVRNV